MGITCKHLETPHEENISSSEVTRNQTQQRRKVSLKIVFLRILQLLSHVVCAYKTHTLQ